MKHSASTTPSFLLNGKPLHDNDYHVLKVFKDEIELVIKSKLNDNPIPFDQLRDVSLTFKVNYAVHFNVPKETVKSALGIGEKSYYDKAWQYENYGYKNKIIAYLEMQKKLVAEPPKNQN